MPADHEELDSCPLCGALPCDWVDNPHQSPHALSTPAPPQPANGERIIAGLEAALAGDVTRVTVLPPQPANGEVVEALRKALEPLAANGNFYKPEVPHYEFVEVPLDLLRAAAWAYEAQFGTAPKLEPSDGR